MAKLSRIAPEMPAKDLESALMDYEQQMGFRVVMRMPGGEYAIVERDGEAIHLIKDRAGKHSPTGIHIFTADLDELFAEFLQSGARVTQKIDKKPWQSEISRQGRVRQRDQVHGAGMTVKPKRPPLKVAAQVDVP